MKILKLILYVVLIFLFSSCSEKPLETIYSTIDGQEYYNDMSAKMSVRKAVRLILENKKKQVPHEFIVLIADSLLTKDKKWRELYFEAFSSMVEELNEKERIAVGPTLFTFFIRNPMLYQSTIDKLPYNKSDLLLEIISCQILESTLDPEITMNSVVNLTMSYCTDCSEKELNFIVSYVELANKLIVD